MRWWPIVVVACGAEPMTRVPIPASDAGMDPRPIELRGPCADDRRFGQFLVEAQERYSLIDGRVAGGVVPASIPELVRAEGECRLLRRQNPFCDPPCGAGETCDLAGKCIPFPRQEDVGIISISGLEKDVAMMPVPPSNDYFDTDVPHPVYKPGKEIRLRGSTLDLGGFGFEVLESRRTEWTVIEGQDLPIAWTGPSEADPKTEIELRLNIDQHGASPVNLSCTLADDGEAAIPAALVDALFRYGVSGFPNGSITRQTVDSVDYGAGCVELRIASPLRADVRVGGHTPCDGPGDCAPPQSCDLPSGTCR
jgi:hypothetical protein